eukprot:3679647-Prymnesium_polylepis.1
MPYIYGAYGRGTRVIQTVRNVTEWPLRRAEWDSTEHLNDTAPMGCTRATIPQTRTPIPALALPRWRGEEGVWVAERVTRNTRCVAPPSAGGSSRRISMKGRSPASRPVCPASTAARTPPPHSHTLPR